MRNLDSLLMGVYAAEYFEVIDGISAEGVTADVLSTIFIVVRDLDAAIAHIDAAVCMPEDEYSGRRRVAIDAEKAGLSMGLHFIAPASVPSQRKGLETSPVWAVHLQDKARL